MSMQAKVTRCAQGNIVIHMQGDLNYEHSIPFRQELQTLAVRHPNARITIDLGAIDFVGSSGICHFVETLKLLKDHNKRIVSLDNVKLEFVKVFRLYGLDETQHIADHMNFDSDETESMNRFQGRTRTFEN